MKALAASFRGVFALMNRSLLTEDRSVRTHLWRFLFVALSYGMVLTAQQSIAWMGAPGLQLFSSMCYLNFFCITIASVGFFSAAITEEKEEMTLGLLKMAGVSSLSLLIGKSTPRLIAALILLTAQLPFTMLAITLGGVSVYQVLAAYTCLFAYLVLVANAALFFSVVCRRSRTAGLLTGVFLFFFFFGPFFSTTARGGMVYNGWLRQDGWIASQWSSADALVRGASAFERVGGILNTGFSESALSYQVIANVLLGLGFLGLGWCLFEVCTRNERPPAEGRGLLSRRIGARHSLLGAGRAWNWALGWKGFHFVGGGKLMILVKFTAYFGILGLIVWMDRRYGSRSMGLNDFGVTALMIGLWAGVLELAIQGSRVFQTEMQWKTLSSIMLLPMGVAEIAYSKLLGTAISLVPAISLCLVGAVCAPSEIGEFLNHGVDEPGFWYFLSQVVLFIHLATIFSLYVKWGALPLAFAAIQGGNMVLMTFASLLFGFGGLEEGFFVIMAFFSLIGCGASHVLIGKRLQEVAAR